jgi:hypothetical protein
MASYSGSFTYMFPELSSSVANLKRETGDCVEKRTKSVCSVFSNALHTVKFKLLLQ